MKKYAKIVGAAEEEYMPSGPPMSPLTASFFTTWAFYDLRFDGTDSLASCQIEANRPGNWWIKKARCEDNEVEATMAARLK
jgi:hypothetical protein